MRVEEDDIARCAKCNAPLIHGWTHGADIGPLETVKCPKGCLVTQGINVFFKRFVAQEENRSV